MICASCRHCSPRAARFCNRCGEGFAARAAARAAAPVRRDHGNAREGLLRLAAVALVAGALALFLTMPRFVAGGQGASMFAALVGLMVVALALWLGALTAEARRL